MSTWEEQDNQLIKNFRCPSFNDAITFISDIANIANEMNHHPDSMLHHQHRSVEVKLTTHDTGGISEKDHALADKIDALHHD